MPGRFAGPNPPQDSRVKRALLPASSFIRSARRLARKNPEVAKDLHAVLALLAEDPWHPRLHTHKVKGALAGSWACSVA